VLRLLLAAVAGVALPLALLASPGTASASEGSGTSAVAAQDPIEVVCKATTTATYTPGLLLAARQVSVDADTQYTPCLGGGVDAGSAGINATFSASCLNLGGSSSGVSAISWNDNTTSFFSYNQTTVNVAGQSVTTRTGSISAGKFTGATALSETIVPTLNFTNCLAPPGITSVTGVGTLTIASL
jgi:hypothetical protein